MIFFIAWLACLHYQSLRWDEDYSTSSDNLWDLHSLCWSLHSSREASCVFERILACSNEALLLDPSPLQPHIVSASSSMRSSSYEQLCPSYLQQNQFQFQLTTKGFTIPECLCKLWPHLDELILWLLKLLSSLCYCTIDHLLETISVFSVENIAEPLLVNVIQIALIWNEFHEWWFLSSKVKKVLCCQTLDLRHCRHFHFLPLYILQY